MGLKHSGILSKIDIDIKQFYHRTHGERAEKNDFLDAYQYYPLSSEIEQGNFIHTIDK